MKLDISDINIEGVSAESYQGVERRGETMLTERALRTLCIVFGAGMVASMLFVLFW